MGRVEGKVAFITGAARGQGRSHAIRLASEGASIIAVDICEPIATMNYPLASEEDLQQTVKEVEAVGGSILASKADVRHREELVDVVARGLEAFGRLDVVCANAGICPSLDSTPLSGFIDATDVDLIGAMNTVAATVPHLQSGASIIITGSTAGLMNGTTENIGASGGHGYMFAKRTVFQYLESIALLLAPHMIRANAIHPTNCDTDLLHNEDVYRAFRPDLEHPTREDAMVALPYMQAMPIPYIDPGDVSALVLFLASDESRYLTGMNIRLDAGAMLKKPPM
ncbi:mycofactocin-coupled SDR family oxidoreductase [Acidiferrimicrobium sp. IK]|uniref:mycofactocin-coupled SDR family oxidoreductase n=1 Tax=Acidiferrimicrobium sp. IK TaxID=2871700 RepID=UPI0021CB0F8D|nr:mycofactocin-coupled SDR family oxidoreductase [Acidiferrimicrobium sp. IK]MCU4182905.1 mycofactocin-coupled SDR family oxidoreductase [Acidiferrimicrobium sp. IK]